MQNLNTSKYIITICISFSFSNLAFADIAELKDFESQLIKQHKNKDFYEINGDLEATISSKLAADPSSFNYDFPKLQKNGYVHITYSPDKKLKFYNFDVSGGGTMGEWSNYVQYQINQHIKFDEFEAARIDQIYQEKIQNNVIYLVQYYDKGDNCIGNYQLRAVEIGKSQLLKSFIFETKNKKLDNISVYYDCSKIKDYNKQPDYLRIKPQTIDILLTDKNDVPQNKYIRYRLGTNSYKFTGYVK